MDGPPAEFATASGSATFTPCGDRRWRVAIDGAYIGEIFESFQEGPLEPSGWGADVGDGRSCPRRGDWMTALRDLPLSGS